MTRCISQGCSLPGNPVDCGGVQIAVMCPFHQAILMAELGLALIAEGKPDEAIAGLRSYQREAGAS